MPLTFPIVWPRRVLIPKRIEPIPAHNNLHGPRSGSGFRQRLGIDAGTWRIKMDIDLYSVVGSRFGDPADPDKIMCYRAVRNLLQGSLNTILVPVYDEGDRGPAVRAGKAPGPVLTPHSDDSEHSDGSEYSQPKVVAELAAPAANRAVALTIDVLTGEALEAGQYIGLGGNRLYEIKTSEPVEGIANRWAVKVWPPLRAAALADDPVEIDDPVCEMTYAGDEWPEAPLDLGVQTSVQLEFEEAPSA